MGAIPTLDMPGHKRLRDRFLGALDICQESKAVDFKESASWDSIKFKAIKTIMGMSNLRDGGIIVIGVSERNQTWDLTGITPEHLKTYDVDVVLDIVNKYASPDVEMDIACGPYRNGLNFLVIYTKEFTDTPIVCKKNGPDVKVLQAGAVYIRPPGKAETTRVMYATQMHDLLELAAEKRARRILEVSRRIGLKTRPTATEQFEKELGGL